MGDITSGAGSPITKGLFNRVSITNVVATVPVAFDPAKFSNIISDFLNIEYFETVGDELDIELQEFNRESEHLLLKNELNGVSADYFNAISQDEQEYFNDINRFLATPRNATIRRKYKGIAKKLQLSYLANYKNEKNLPEHIQFIIKEVYNSISNIDEDIDFYIPIFIHHMYYYCDYGINP